jgi:hypothetical protein
MKNIIPIYLKKDNTAWSDPVSYTKHKKKLQRRKTYYCCKFCRTKITLSKYRIKVLGKFKHICANPHGILFEVGCFSDASNCIPVEKPTKEFTWFPGYAWQILVCANCLNHLGWLYTSSKSHFFGLILGNLTQEEEK